MKRILVVEDDASIQEILQNFLESDGYQVWTAQDGVEAISVFQKEIFDLILLDIMLPKIDGYGVCEVIRKESGIPILMLTALDEEECQIKGFDLQADDYITKPFSMPVLLRKVAAVLRRVEGKKQDKKLVYENLILDLEGYQVLHNQEIIDFTPKEFELLKELLLHQGKVLTRQILLENIWNYDYYGDDRVVDTHIKNIRKKLNNRYIDTIRGVGYRIAKENKK